MATAASTLSFGCLGLGESGDESDDEENDGIDRVRASQMTIDELNNARIDEGLNELEGNDVLAEVALEHTEYIANQSELSRTGPDGRGPSERAEEAGYECEREVAQNSMRLGNPSGLGEREAALTIVDTFLEEEPTRERLLDSNRAEHGFAMVVGDEHIYVTHLIC